jgi:hypothetical protein
MPQPRKRPLMGMYSEIVSKGFLFRVQIRLIPEPFSDVTFFGEIEICARNPWDAAGTLHDSELREARRCT